MGIGIRTRPDSKRSKKLGFQMVWISNGIWNPDKWLPFCQKPFEIRPKMSRVQKFVFSNGIDIAIAQPFENWSIWNLILKSLDFEWSDSHCNLKLVYDFFCVLGTCSRKSACWSKHIRYLSAFMKFQHIIFQYSVGPKSGVAIVKCVWLMDG